MRQTPILLEYDPPRGVSVATLAYEYKAGYKVAEHAHGSDQLIYAIHGAMEVSSGRNLWFIPPQFALWLPARTRHQIHMRGAVSMRTLYFRAGLVPGFSSRCSVLHVVPLLRELILEAVRTRQLRVRNPYEHSLRDVLIAQLKRASPIPTFVMLPEERRALSVAQAVLANPGQSVLLATLCADAGMSVRTLQRIFSREIGTDFETWRRQLRLTRATELLVAGFSVKEVAFSIGFSQPSAFVAAFRKAFGSTPKAWVMGLKRPESS